MYPAAKIQMFYYMDVRAPGHYEDFYRKVAADQRVKIIRGKATKIGEDAATGDLVIEADDTVYGGKVRTRVNMAVLAIGTVPTPPERSLPGAPMTSDEYGFALAGGVPGIHPAGVAKRPMDVASAVRDGTATALRAIQDVVATPSRVR